MIVADEIETDEVTRRWMRNRSDEYAVAAGCRFDEERGADVCEWIESHCHLYEGSRALIKLMPWERDFIMRLFGWIRWGKNLPSGSDDRWIRRFTRASLFAPKKSGKSPFLAAISLYMLCGDGEIGNHVFYAAADGGQARIAAKHAVEMVKASPELTRIVSINLSEMKLTHLPSGSDAKPVSSGDKKAAQSKQGVNGSVMIDEVHVITPSFISESSIDQAGISRDEPLHIEISTAGKDPESYGRRQYDYGKLVESGETEDNNVLFVVYESPQDLTDEDLFADPVKWGRIANPSWGYLVREDEYLSHFNRVKGSLANLADFKTFRLNIWQQAASPWLRLDNWKACAAKYTADDLAGRSCCAGLDLSKTRDMTALVFCFPMGGERFRLLPFFFLPKASADNLTAHFPQMADWIKKGFIRVTDDDVVDYGVLEEVFVACAGMFSIEKLIYDPHQAEKVTQDLAEATGVVREEFAQTITNFNSPTQDFERLVISGAMEHDGNPVMTWQIGHTKVKTDNNANKRPIKPTPDDPKKIDGVVAGIQALAGAVKIVNWWEPGQGM